MHNTLCDRCYGAAGTNPKDNKPKSKVIMLDPKPTSSNKGLFRDALKRHYGYGSANAMIEWHGEDGVVGVDLKTKTVKTAKGKTFESTIHKDVYVIDDVAIATPLPKSGYAANSEANLAAVVTGKSMIEP